jgi:hypothetical protein
MASNGAVIARPPPRPLPPLVLDAEIGSDHLGIVADRRRRAVGDLDAVVEHHDVVGYFHDHRHVVFDQQNRRVVIVADEAQEIVQVRAFARIETRRRLVQAQQHGIGAHRTRDLKPSLFAVCEAARQVVAAMKQPGAIEPVAALVPRGRQTMIVTIAAPNSSMRYCSNSRNSSKPPIMTSAAMATPIWLTPCRPAPRWPG